MPQTHPPAAEAEVDFHDLWVMLAGVKTKTALFTMRLSYSARTAHRAFLTQGQEAFLEGHVYGFDRLGGVPCDKVRYDNLTSAVKQVLFGRSRQENERWIAFKSDYGPVIDSRQLKLLAEELEVPEVAMSCSSCCW